MATWGIILAAGAGTRLAEATGGIAKQFLAWRGRPLYWHSGLAMAKSACIAGIIFVLPQEELATESERIAKLARLDRLGLEWRAVPGGATRQESSAAGVAALPPDCDKTLIHDAARCFTSAGLFRRIHDGLASSPCVIPALPVTDTIKLTNPEQADLVCRTLPRAQLAAAQTPQGFQVKILRQAMAKAHSGVTDDASLLELAGYEVRMIPGEPDNIKITTAADLVRLGRQTEIPCTGFGYDAHRFGGGRPLRIGGIAIPTKLQIEAHSDGDVLLHSLMDAMLGCACLGDIGAHFPDSSAEYAGISSAILLDRVLTMLAEANTTLTHVDLTVVAQKPKLAPYATQIRKNVARLLDLPLDAVNFKATTEEKMGFTGRLEGIKAYSIVNAVKFQRD